MTSRIPVEPTLPSGLGPEGPQSLALLKIAPQGRAFTLWLLTAVVFLLTGGVTFAVAYFGTGSHGGVANAPPNSGNTSIRATTLGMQVEPQAENFVIRWDRQMAVVQAAKEGLLRIDDGGQHREIHLDASQIADGSILYRPTSDDVAFRLEISDSRGPSGSESVRVLGQSAPNTEVSIEASQESPTVVPAAQPVSRQETQVANVTEISPRATRDTAAKVSGGSPSTLSMPDKASNESGQKTALIPLATVPLPQPMLLTQALAAELPTKLPEAGVKSAVLSKEQPAGTPTRPSAEESPVTQAPPTRAPALDAKSALSYVPPRPVRWVRPDTTRLGSFKPTDIQVKVKIDADGHVLDAQVLSGGSKSKKVLDQAATAAAKQWVFEPAKVHGKNVASDDTIVFRFTGKAQ